MGMYGGYLTGRRLRRQDDLQQSKFEEDRRQAELSNQRQDRVYGLQEQKFEEDKVQTGLKGIRSDREYELRKKQYGEQSRRADENVALGKRDEARKEAEAQRKTQQDVENRAAGRYGNAYQAALMGDEDEAVRLFNMDQDPMKHITGLTIDEQGNMLIDRRGVQAKIPYDQIRRYLPRDPTEGVGRSGGLTGAISPQERKYQGLLGYHRAAKQYEFPKDKKDRTGNTVLPGAQDAFVASQEAGRSPEQGAMELELPMKLPPEVTEEVKEIDDRLEELSKSAELDRLQEKTPWWAISGKQAWEGFRIRQARAEILLLEQRKQALLDQAVLGDPVVQAANQELVQQFSGFDSNQDGQIDELDQDYQRAQQLVDRMKANPALRAALIQNHGAAAIAEAEALVKAVQQKAKLTAERRVGLGK